MSDRKYGQRGYLEDDRAPSRRRPASREGGEGPRGRGLGAPTDTVASCARCGETVPVSRQADDVCQGCGSDLHTCTNCGYFDPSAPSECRLEIEVRIAAKSKRNDCELFEPKLVKEFARDGGSSGSAGDPKAAFDDLFNF